MQSPSSFEQDKGKHHREGAFIVMISPFENETEVKNDLLSGGGAVFFFYEMANLPLKKSERTSTSHQSSHS